MPATCSGSRSPQTRGEPEFPREGSWWRAHTLADKPEPAPVGEPARHPGRLGALRAEPLWKLGRSQPLTFPFPGEGPRWSEWGRGRSSVCSHCARGVLGGTGPKGTAEASDSPARSGFVLNSKVTGSVSSKDPLILLILTKAFTFTGGFYRILINLSLCPLRGELYNLSERASTSSARVCWPWV